MKTHQGGFIKALIVIIIAIGLLAYFNVDLRQWADKFHLKDLLTKIGPYLSAGWAKVVDLWHYLTQK